MPYLSGRLESVSEVNAELRKYIPDGLQSVLESLYFDCALSANAVHFAALKTLVDDSQILFGTDFPFGPKRQIAETVSGLNGLELPHQTMQQIEHDNVFSLFSGLKSRILASKNLVGKSD